MHHHFPQEFYDYLKSNTLTEIKTGNDRFLYTEIWMVHVEKRVFARSWNKSLKGWLGQFLDNGNGVIKFGNSILNVSVETIDYNDVIQASIDKAYLEKYTQEHNLEYAHQISKQEYYDFTVEFFAGQKFEKIVKI